MNTTKLGAAFMAGLTLVLALPLLPATADINPDPCLNATAALDAALADAAGGPLTQDVADAVSHAADACTTLNLGHSFVPHRLPFDTNLYVSTPGLSADQCRGSEYFAPGADIKTIINTGTRTVTFDEKGWARFSYDPVGQHAGGYSMEYEAHGEIAGELARSNGFGLIFLANLIPLDADVLNIEGGCKEAGKNVCWGRASTLHYNGAFNVAVYSDFNRCPP